MVQLPWSEVVPAACALAERLAHPAQQLRQVVCDTWTVSPVGIYTDWTGKIAALYSESGDPKDTALIKEAVSEILPVCNLALTTDEAQSGDWIKLAYSPFVRGVGSFLNYFPDNYTKMPWLANPITAGLTSGLVGAGLGYAGGRIATTLMPEKWDKKRLPRTLALLGGLAGVAPAAFWAGNNLAEGKHVWDNSLLSQPPNDTPRLGDLRPFAIDNYTSGLPEEIKSSAYNPGIDVNTLGWQLNQSGDPNLAGATLSILGAAQQMPGGSGPGWVTPVQMGYLAANMGAGYVSGAIVGKVLGALTGMPQESQEKLRQTGMYAGLVQAVLPRLFGGR